MTDEKNSPPHQLTSSPLRPLVIFGAGGLGREVAVLIRQLNAAGANWDLRGFYDDQPPAALTVAGLPYLGDAAALAATPEPLAVAVAVGSSPSRADVVSRLNSRRLSFPTLIHPDVQLAEYQRIIADEGCIIQRGCLLTCDIRLGRFVLLNLGCTVGHDAVLADFCSLMPQANVSGATQLGTGAYLGAGAVVLPGIRVGDWATLGAGAVAVRDVPAGATVVGVPARPLKSERDG